MSPMSIPDEIMMMRPKKNNHHKDVVDYHPPRDDIHRNEYHHRRRKKERSLCGGCDYQQQIDGHGHLEIQEFDTRRNLYRTESECYWENDSHFNKPHKNLAHRNVDRKTTCPFLLRIFLGPYKLRTNEENSAESSSTALEQSTGTLEQSATMLESTVATEELQVYTWTDATMREVTELVKDVLPEAREPLSKLHFTLVPFFSGNDADILPSSLKPKKIGCIISGRFSKLDQKTLSCLNFNVGDYLELIVEPFSSLE